jgi:hypothetical protein
VMTALMTDDRGWSRSSRMDNTVDRLDEAIKLYVTKLTRGSLDERGGRRAAEIISFAINLEHIGDIIDRNLCEVAAKKIKRRLQFSNEGVAELMGRRGILPPGVIEPCIPIPNLAAESPFGPGGVQLICGPLMVIPSRRLPASCRAAVPGIGADVEDPWLHALPPAGKTIDDRRLKAPCKFSYVAQAAIKRTARPMPEGERQDSLMCRHRPRLQDRGQFLHEPVSFSATGRTFERLELRGSDDESIEAAVVSVLRGAIESHRGI